MVSTTREARLTAAFVTLADTLVADYDVLDLLHTLTDTCADLLDASAAGLTLADDAGNLEVLASTSEESRLVELMQLRDGAGPCIEAYRTGEVIVVPDVEEVSEVWPVFSRDALAQGYRSVHCIPMQLRGENIGSLNLFRTSLGTLPDDDIAVARGLADIATIGILHQRALHESDVARVQLQRALDSRVLIEQAKGVLAQTHALDMNAAFALLRNHARASGARLQDVARGIVERRLEI
ncbi:GAF and ANTAR domain-containing protein [Agreia sp.]|uniref:GAF and ANTAR domain-containing protein n=1 Tax=Agreia sp. TaxID=1872416 RepID=UPI0035BC2C70